MAASSSALPLQIRSAEERADPIRHGLWSQTVHELQTLQCIYARQGDLFKLSQSVFLQAFGGYGVEALRLFVTDMFLQEIGLANPTVGVAVATCCLKWQNTPVTLENQHQFLTDLYNTCEIVTRAPKSRVLLHLVTQYRRQARSSLTAPLDLSHLAALLHARQGTPQVLGVLLAQWAEARRWEDLDQWVELLAARYDSGPDTMVPTFLTMYRQEDRPDLKFQWVILMLHGSGYDRTRIQAAKLPAVSDPVNVDALWRELFPAQLALPVYTAAEGQHWEALHMALQRLSLDARPMERGD